MCGRVQRPEACGARESHPSYGVLLLQPGRRDWTGRPFRKAVSVPKGEVQALWCGVQIPREAQPGGYRSTLTVAARAVGPQAVTVELDVRSAVAEDHGDADLWRHSRLRWLDSTIGLDDEVTAPYTPLRVRGPAAGCLGREVRFGGTGLRTASCPCSDDRGRGPEGCPGGLGEADGVHRRDAGGRRDVEKRTPEDAEAGKQRVDPRDSQRGRPVRAAVPVGDGVRRLHQL